MMAHFDEMCCLGLCGFPHQKKIMEGCQVKTEQWATLYYIVVVVVVAAEMARAAAMLSTWTKARRRRFCGGTRSLGL